MNKLSWLAYYQLRASLLPFWIIAKTCIACATKLMLKVLMLRWWTDPVMKGG